MFSEPTSLQRQKYLLSRLLLITLNEDLMKMLSITQAPVFEKTSWLDSELQIQGIKKIHSVVLVVSISICLLGAPIPGRRVPLSQVTSPPSTLQLQEGKGIQRGAQAARNHPTPLLYPCKQNKTSLLQNWLFFVFLRQECRKRKSVGSQTLSSKDLVEQMVY